jgi:hypothetical protein
MLVCRRCGRVEYRGLVNSIEQDEYCLCCHYDILAKAKPAASSCPQSSTWSATSKQHPPIPLQDIRRSYEHVPGVVRGQSRSRIPS